MSALHYAIRDNNLQAIKALAAELKAAGVKKERVGAPKCYLKTFGTGVYNYRFFYLDICCLKCRK
jgi:hypothetical protein